MGHSKQQGCQGRIAATWPVRSASARRVMVLCGSSTIIISVTLRSMVLCHRHSSRSCYEPLRHPRAPGLSLAGVRLVIAGHASRLPVLRTLSLCACCRHYPGAAAGPTPARSPSRISLPRKGCRVGLRIWPSRNDDDGRAARCHSSNSHRRGTLG